MVVHDPDTCYCFECSLRAWALSYDKEEADLRSKKTPVIEIQKVRTTGEMPLFLGVLQRHWEKSKPAIADPKKATLVAPIEMLDFLVPQALLANFESVEILYEKK
jgi:hypothetical protein